MKRPVTKEDKIALRLEADVRLRLEGIAEAEGRSLSDVVRRIVVKALEGKKRKKPA
ncbi:MAG: hypothetical protein AABZ64_07360 [Nitrospinota bacterium]